MAGKNGTAQNLTFTVGKPNILLKDYFGTHPGQSSAEFVKEVKEMSEDDKNECVQAIANIYYGDEKLEKKYAIEVVTE